MISPLRARYGARDNSHALLLCDGGQSRLPAALLGLTDKPPGSYAPGERWWPSVGCGPVEEWWALWWTEPDEQATRGGMVRSEVALWRLDEVGKVDDLRSVMESLGGRDHLAAPSRELLGAIAEALLSPDKGRPVLAELDLWPGLVAALWARLWPEARQAFSARVAISPPQGGESVAPPWMFGVPADRALQWSRYQVVTVASRPGQLSRAARWLMGEGDPTLEEVLNGCASRPSELGSLSRVARAADRLEGLRKVPDPQHALEFLRTLVVVAPTPYDAVRLKEEGVGVLVRGLAGVPSDVVMKLANLDVAHLPTRTALEGALKGWIDRNASSLALEEASQLLKTLAPERAKTWWQQAVHAGLSAGLAKPEPPWAKAALNWLGLPEAHDVLRDLIPATDAVEQRLLGITTSIGLSSVALQQVRLQATARRWSRLHAWAAMQDLSPRETFQAQWTFADDPFPGLSLLVERLPGATVVEEAVARMNQQFTKLVAKRTSREPAVLRTLDAGKAGWRALWAAHVVEGGTHWPAGVNREALGRDLLVAVLAGDEPEGLIAPLAEELADTALSQPNRTALWDILSSTARNALLPHVAGALAQLCNAGQVVSTVEQPLSEAVASLARRTRPSAYLIASLLRWDARIGEDEVIHWLGSPKHAEWLPVAGEVGRAVLIRQWKRAAEAIYVRCLGVLELRPAALACQDLLTGWQRFRLSLLDSPRASRGADDTPLVERVAELGADLAPDSLDHIWERAGGKRKQLRSWGSPANRWRDAVLSARNGALEGGLAALIRELRHEFPHSDGVKEVERVLTAWS